MRPSAKKLLTVLVLGFTLFLSGASFAAVQVDEALFREIEANLMCTDGCGMYLKACDNATAEKMRAEIREKLAEGALKEEVYAYMISIYGEEVMAAPPPKNPLNITAWVLPFIGILGGGAVIYTALDKWVFYRGGREIKSDDIDVADLAAYDEMVSKEINKYY